MRDMHIPYGAQSYPNSVQHLEAHNLARNTNKNVNIIETNLLSQINTLYLPGYMGVDSNKNVVPPFSNAKRWMYTVSRKVLEYSKQTQFKTCLHKPRRCGQ